MASRNTHYMSRYGITVDDYDRMLEEQGGCCAICNTDTPSGRRGRFSIDHNHETGEVRGLLCQKCNAGLGYFKDSPTILATALKYLLEQGHYGELKSTADSVAGDGL